jgi:hypothetical protein
VVALGTVPWLLLRVVETQAKLEVSASTADAASCQPRPRSSGAESMVAIPWLGWARGLVLLRHRFTRGDQRSPRERSPAMFAVTFALLGARSSPSR